MDDQPILFNDFVLCSCLDLIVQNRKSVIVEFMNEFALCMLSLSYNESIVPIIFQFALIFRLDWFLES